MLSRDKFEVCSSDVIFQAAPLSFDPSIVNLLVASRVGATLVVVSDDVRRQPRKVCKILEQNKVTVMQVNLLDFILRQQSVLVHTMHIVDTHCSRHRHFFVTFLETCCVQASYRKQQVFAFWRSEAKIVRRSTSSDTGEVMGAKRNCSTCTASLKCLGL